jgi:hypothetical protein
LLTKDKELSGHVWEVWQLAVRDNYLFSGSFDHTIKVRCHCSCLLTIAKWHTDLGFGYVRVRKGKQVSYSTHESGHGSSAQTMEGHKGYIHALCTADNYLASASGDKTIKVNGCNNLMLIPGSSGRPLRRPDVMGTTEEGEGGEIKILLKCTKMQGGRGMGHPRGLSGRGVRGLTIPSRDMQGNPWSRGGTPSDPATPGRRRPT